MVPIVAENAFGAFSYECLLTVYTHISIAQYKLAKILFKFAALYM